MSGTAATASTAKSTETKRIGGASGGGGGGGAPMSAHPHQRNESILELQKMMDALVHVKCLGGREFKGILRGFDDLVNLVLDDSDEFIRGACAVRSRNRF